MAQRPERTWPLPQVRRNVGKRCRNVPVKKKKESSRKRNKRKTETKLCTSSYFSLSLTRRKKKKKVRKAAQPATRRHCSKPNRKIAHTQITSGTHLLISKAVFSFLYFLLRLSLCTKKTKFDMMRAKQPTLHKYYARPFVTPTRRLHFWSSCTTALFVNRQLGREPRQTERES